MDAFKTLEKINNRPVDDYITKKIDMGKRRSTSIDFIKEMNKKFPIKNLNDDDAIGVSFFKQFIISQAKLCMVGILVSIDWQKKEYYCVDMKYGETYQLDDK